MVRVRRSAFTTPELEVDDELGGRMMAAAHDFDECFMVVWNATVVHLVSLLICLDNCGASAKIRSNWVTYAAYIDHSHISEDPVHRFVRMTHAN